MVDPVTAHVADNTAPTTSARDALASLAGQIKHASTGTAARLRRTRPQQDGGGALFEVEWMLQAAEIFPRDDAEHQRWALVLHCLATAGGLHDARAEPGAVLSRLRFTEARMRQLVEADEATLADLLPRLARRVAAAGAALNWWPLADLLLHAGQPSEVIADRARRRLVHHFLRAQSASAAAVPAV